MASLDVSVAKLQHQRWRMRLQGFLDGHESLTEAEATSHRDCMLGKWIYSIGMKDFGNIPEMQTLERIHADMHNLIKRIIQRKNAGDESGAQSEFEKVGPISNEIGGLLDTIESRI